MHKGLKRVYLQGDPKGVPAQAVTKLNNARIFTGYGEPGRADSPANVEGASNERGSERNMEPERNMKLAINIPLRS